MTVIHKFFFGLIACVCLLIWDTAVSQTHADAADPKAVAAFFDDVALGEKSSGRIVKWLKAPIVRLEAIAPSENNYDEPVRIATPLADYEFVARHIAELRLLTGLPVRLLPRDISLGGDIVVTITPWHLARKTAVSAAPRRLLRRLMGPGRCFFVLWNTPESGIQKAQIIINSKLDKEHVRHCFLEEITQSMGLPFDSNRVRPSIFNEASLEASLSDTDAILIRTLYDPRIMLGMDRMTLNVWAPSIIEKMMTGPN